MHRHDTPPTSETGPNGGLMALGVVFLVNKTHLSRGFRLHDGGVDQAGAGLDVARSCRRAAGGRLPWWSGARNGSPPAVGDGASGRGRGADRNAQARRDPWAGAAGQAGERGFVLVALVRAGVFLHDDHETKEDSPDANHACGDRYCMSGHCRLHHSVARQSWSMSRRPQ